MRAEVRAGRKEGDCLTHRASGLHVWTLCGSFPGERWPGQRTPDSKLVTDHSKATIKVQLWEPVRFMGIVYKNTGKESITEAKMTQTAALPKSPPTKTGNLEHTSQPASSSLGWRMFFQSSLVGLSLTWSPLQGSSAYSRVSLSSSFCLCMLREGET